MLLLHDIRFAASRIFCTAGSRSPIKMAMMAMTTSNSMGVKARPDALYGKRETWESPQNKGKKTIQSRSVSWVTGK